jgi:hypothetical protein
MLLPLNPQESNVPEMLISYTFGQHINWTRVNVHNVAPLLQLAYWTAKDLLIKHEEKLTVSAGCLCF